jgi:hypothetical protein
VDIQLLGPAQEEIDEAHAYYELQMKGLGFQFLDELFYRMRGIKHHPEAWPPFSHRTRRCLLPKFPYAVIYQLRDDTILIIAISHLHRKPEYWNNRL